MIYLSTIQHLCGSIINKSVELHKNGKVRILGEKAISLKNESCNVKLF